MDEQLFKDNLVQSNRILYTPSLFAKTNLLHLQEIGELKALRPHTSQREKLNSYLFFIVLDGEGTLTYEGQTFSLTKGQCVFLNCHKPYSQRSSSQALWTLKWVHFNGPTMEGIFDKYSNRGGIAVVTSHHYLNDLQILDDLLNLAASDDIIKDMKISELLSKLLVSLMETTILSETSYQKRSGSKDKLTPIKNYLDSHYHEKITLDELSKRFFINKFYLTRLFKEQYGTSINSYITHKRISKAKELLRFTDLSIEEIGQACGVNDSSYFTRIFCKIEGLTPRDYRKLW